MVLCDIWHRMTWLTVYSVTPGLVMLGAIEKHAEQVNKQHFLALTTPASSSPSCLSVP